MSTPIQVPGISIRITQAAWRGRDETSSANTFISFVCQPKNITRLFPRLSNTDVSPELAHSLALECLERFWSESRSCTAIVSNISMDERRDAVYLLRPVVEGAATAGYGTDDGIPAFRCKVQGGFFVAISFEYGFYSEQNGPEDITLIGSVYVQTPPEPGEVRSRTRPLRALPFEVLQRISGLKSRRLLISRRLEQWRSFLEWQRDLVQKRQFALRYDSIEVDGRARSILFSALAPLAEWQKFKPRSFEAIVMPLNTSQQPDKWVPINGAMGVSLGELSGKQIRIEGGVPSRPTGQGTDEGIRRTIEIYPGPDAWRRCRGQIPREGFLVKAVHMNLVPIKRQLSALDKLVNGQCRNPRLGDFLFEAGKARLPDGPIVEPPQIDREYLPDPNPQQIEAVAKALVAPDLFLLQGPPGTGKTKVLALICDILAKRGLRILVASQANSAVDKILSSLARRPSIRLLRIAKDDDSDDEQSPFAEDKSVHSWLSSIASACKAMIDEGEGLATSHEHVSHEWPRITNMVREGGELISCQRTLAGRIQAIDGTIENSDKALSQLKRQSSDYSAAAGTLTNTLYQLRNQLPSPDTGEWVQLIPRASRARLFAGLTSWRQKYCQMVILRGLLPGPKSDEPDEPQDLQTTATGRLGNWLSGYFPRRQQESTPQLAVRQVEPNWAVEWIERNALLRNLSRLCSELPKLLQLCEEGERLCAAESISVIPEEDWARFTGELHNALKGSLGESLGVVPGLSKIAISLRPSRRFAGSLANARASLSEASLAAGRMRNELASILLRIAQASAAYMSKCLNETDARTQKARSGLDLLKSHQNQANRDLAGVRQQVGQLSSAWSDIIGRLPADLVTRAGRPHLPLAADSLAVLETARLSYLSDTQGRLSHNQRWGPIRQRWLNLIGHPEQTCCDGLTPLYAKRCNIVGVTCSWSGNYREFLTRPECRGFDVVIIDEVSKATPPEILMPALLGAKLILGGDFKQLPPTFKEGRGLERNFRELAETDEDRDHVMRYKDMVTAGLFKKLLHDVPDIIKQELLVEYRFGLQILDVINQFYDGRLKCGRDDSAPEFNHGLTITTTKGDLLTPDNHVLWVDTSSDEKNKPAYEEQVGTGKANRTEIRAIIRLVKLLNEAARQAGRPKKTVDLGIITFYGHQVEFIRRQLNKLDACETECLNISVDTVDNFQGDERAIVIVSLVRSTKGEVGEFPRAFERINVAMSRAQQLLIVLGALRTFRGVEVPLPSPDGRVSRRMCYAQILDVIRRYGGLRNMGELF